MAAPAAARDAKGPLSADRPIRVRKRDLPFPANLYQTAVGKKWVMGLTGVVLLGFVVSHMIGNLKLYLGVVEFEGELIYDADAYAEALREMLVPIMPHGVVLWLIRLVLIAAFVFHIHSAYSLARMSTVSNRAYQSKRDWLAANFASRSMRYTGTIVLAYLIFHLADLTWGWIPNTEFEHGAVQSNVVNSFSNPIVALIYVVANILLAVHIYHGVYSMFQSLGINNPSYNGIRRGLAIGLALIILVGNVSFPLAVQAGLIEFDASLVS